MSLRSCRHLPRLANYSKIEANRRPASQLRYFTADTKDIQRNSHRSPVLLTIRKAPFKLNTDIEDVLDGIVDIPLGLSKQDAFFTKQIQSGFTSKKASFLMPEIRGLTDAIESKQAHEAWVQFKHLYDDEMVYLRRLSRLQWSELFLLISNSTHNAKENWTRAELIFNSMIRVGHEMTAREFTSLIKCASRARLPQVVQEIWNGISKAGIPRTVELWNSYMRATCNADETLWQRKFNGGKHVEEPVATNDPLNIVSQILADGLSPDATTYELVVLSLGQSGNLDYAAAVTSSVWGIKLDDAPLDEDLITPLSVGAITSPRISTLVSIINAYGSSNELVEGLKIMEKMQSRYKISISGDYALLLWETILKWSYYSTEPWGNTPGIAMDAIWTSIIDRHHINPNSRMLFYKAKRELALRNYEGMIELLPLVMESHNVKNKNAQASSILHQAALGLANSGQLESCKRALDAWAPMGQQFALVREKLHQHIAMSPRIGKWSSEILKVEELGTSPPPWAKNKQVVEKKQTWEEEKEFDLALA